MSEEFTYMFRKTHSGSPGNHCTYCPKMQSEGCGLSCAKTYEALLEERKADGVTVNDEPTI